MTHTWPAAARGPEQSIRLLEISSSFAGCSAGPAARPLKSAKLLYRPLTPYLLRNNNIAQCHCLVVRRAAMLLMVCAGMLVTIEGKTSRRLMQAGEPICAQLAAASLCWTDVPHDVICECVGGFGM